VRFPWDEVMRIEAQFATGQAVTPGQGQTVTVAGVKVGDIANVRLEDGQAILGLDLDPDKLGPLYRNARMLLRPKTGLNDMSVQLDPGRPDPGLPDRGRLRDGDRLAAANTQPNVNPDEILAALDTDTRRYLSIVANAGGEGLRGRGRDLRELLSAAEPTLERTARVARAIADRRAKLRRLVSNIRRLSEATAGKDRELAGLVSASSAVFSTLGRRENRLAASVGRLPGALGATREALVATRGLAAELGPAATELRPAVRDLAPALVRLRPLLREAPPILSKDVRPLVREAVPLVKQLRPSVRRLELDTPNLNRSLRVLNHVVNELGFNPEGSEEGYLFWTSWFFHNANSILSVEDAHGVAWRGLVLVGCSTAGQSISAIPALGALDDLPSCAEDPSARPRKAR